MVPAPELLDRFIDASAERGFAPRTLDLWRGYARHFLRWVGLRDLGALTPDDVRAYLEKLRGFVPHTRKQRMWVVHHLFDWLQSSGLVSVNPVICHRSGKRVPTESEMSRLLAAANTRTSAGSRDRAIAELMYSGGAWSEEVCRLDCADLSEGTARVRYYGKDRSLLLGSAACAAIQDYVERWRPRFARESPALFLQRSGARLTTGVIRGILKRLARKARIDPVTPNQFRYACAAHMLAAGAELRNVQELLRHVDTPELKKVHRLYHPRERLHGSVPAPPADTALWPEEVLDGYIEACARRGAAPQTLDQQRSHTRRFLEWVGDRDLGALTGEDVRAYAEELRGLALQSQKHRMWVVRDLFAWLQSSGKSFSQEIPAESEMDRLLAAANTRRSIGKRDRAILELMYSAGLRGEEVERLDCADLDLASGTVRVRYRGRSRLGPVGEAACRALQEYLERSRPGFVPAAGSPALFLASDQSSQAGTRLRLHAVKAIIKRLARKAGIDHPISSRQFRYACASHMLNAGADRKHVQQLLGHVPIDTAEMKKLHRLYHPRARSLP